MLTLWWAVAGLGCVPARHRGVYLVLRSCERLGGLWLPCGRGWGQGPGSGVLLPGGGGAQEEPPAFPFARRYFLDGGCLKKGFWRQKHRGRCWCEVLGSSRCGEMVCKLRGDKEKGGGFFPPPGFICCLSSAERLREKVRLSLTWESEDLREKVLQMTVSPGKPWRLRFKTRFWLLLSLPSHRNLLTNVAGSSNVDGLVLERKAVCVKAGVQ